MTHPIGPPTPKGNLFHHSPAVTPLSPTHILLRVVVAPSLSMRRPMNFLSMYGITSIVVIIMPKTTVHIIMACMNDSRAGCMPANPSWRLKIGPTVKGSGHAQVLGMVTCRSISSDGIRSCTLSIDQLVRESVHPTMSNQSLLVILSPICLSDTRIKRTHDCRDVSYLVANHALSCEWDCNENRRSN